MTVIHLPFPPSVNEIYRNAPGVGRVKTAAYRGWALEAGLMLNRQNISPFVGRCVVVIDLDDKRQGDADNRNKAVLDLLVERKILQGDSKKHVKRVSVGWEEIEGCRVTIMEAA